jgi:hypothetical protein
MANVFTILIGTDQYTYDKIEDIPETFDYLIRFEPEYPEPPHSEQQHAYIDSFPFMMQELKQRETKPYSKENRNRQVRKPKSPDFKMHPEWNNNNG